jgi:hypothetical protein
LRLLAIGADYPRPQTQIPAESADGCRRYFLNMGWPDLMLALEYDAEADVLRRLHRAWRPKLRADREIS